MSSVFRASDRITLYPAAPIRLATMLYTWTITGRGRTDASRIGGVGLQIIRDWVLRFNARGPDGLVDGKSPGAPSKLNADHRRALAEVVEARRGTNLVDGTFAKETCSHTSNLPTSVPIGE